jgi:hypothetical protein
MLLSPLGRHTAEMEGVISTSAMKVQLTLSRELQRHWFTAMRRPGWRTASHVSPGARGVFSAKLVHPGSDALSDQAEHQRLNGRIRSAALRHLRKGGD